MRAGGSDSDLTENDRGTGPATPVSPSGSANESDDRGPRRPSLLVELIWVADELTDDFAGGTAQDEGAEQATIAQYGRMLVGIRKLPRQMRALARREALKWLRSELKGLRDRRASSRRAAHANKRRKVGWRGVWRDRLSDPRP